MQLNVHSQAYRNLNVLLNVTSALAFHECKHRTCLLSSAFTFCKTWRTVHFRNLAKQQRCDETGETMRVCTAQLRTLHDKRPKPTKANASASSATDVKLWDALHLMQLQLAVARSRNLTLRLGNCKNPKLKCIETKCSARLYHEVLLTSSFLSSNLSS